MDTPASRTPGRNGASALVYAMPMTKTLLLIVAVLAVILLIAFGTRRILPYAEYTTAPGAMASDSGAAGSGADAPSGEPAGRGTTMPMAPAPAPTTDADAPAPSGSTRGAGGQTAAPPPPSSPVGGEQPDAGDAARHAPDPATILERASAAYSDVRSLQADFTMAMTNPLLRRTTNSRGTLYQQRPDRIALRFSEPDGDVIVGDGRYFWIYYPSVDAQQVIRMPASQGAAGGVDLQAQFLGNPVERFDATLHGTERVSGRDAYALTLVPRGPAGYEQLRVWLDTEDYLARRFEITEETGTVRRFDLTGLRINGSIAQDIFRFSPPADARVVERG